MTVTNPYATTIDEQTKARVRQRLQTYNTSDVCSRSGLTSHELMQVSYGFMDLPEETWFILARRMGLDKGCC